MNKSDLSITPPRRVKISYRPEFVRMVEIAISTVDDLGWLDHELQRKIAEAAIAALDESGYLMPDLPGVEPIRMYSAQDEIQ